MSKLVNLRLGDQDLDRLVVLKKETGLTAVDLFRVGLQFVEYYSKEQQDVVREIVLLVKSSNPLPYKRGQERDLQ